jgi:catechol 2,3-dioxygenase-like lactoylglutathione lyase family enzyme
MATSFQITVDCADAERMVRFWSTALGYVEEPPPTGFFSWQDFLRANGIEVPPPGSIGAIVDPDRVGPRILFLRVAEPKSVKNRLHFDLRAGGGDGAKDAKIAELRAAGATELRRVDENGQWWMVMSDPEGNEFCVT